MGRRTIGRLAREAGVSVETVRYYQRRGLLPCPDPAEGRWRVYGEESVFAIWFIKRMQDLGFTLREIGELLSWLHDAGTFCHNAGDAAEAKIDQLEGKIRELTRIRDVLASTFQACRAQDKEAVCLAWESLLAAFRVDDPRRIHT